MQKFHTVCACLLLLGGVAVAQAAKSESKTVSQALDRSVSNVDNEFVPAADAMPEDKYSFVPTTWPQSTTYWPLLFWKRNHRGTRAEKAGQTQRRAKLTSSNT